MFDKIASAAAQRLGESDNHSDLPQSNGGPLGAPVRGLPNNWGNYVYHTSQGDAAHYVRDSPDVAGAVATLAERAVERWNANADYPHSIALAEWDAQQVYDLCFSVARRWGVGAVGENFVIDVLCDGEVAPERDGDERRGIDVRSNGTTYQVKTTTDYDDVQVDDPDADRTVVVLIDEMTGDVLDYKQYKN